MAGCFQAENFQDSGTEEQGETGDTGNSQILARYRAEATV